MLQVPAKPEIICLCGSTRFTNEMLIVKWHFEKQAIIVLSWNVLPESYTETESHIAEQENVKEILDELHKRKIDLADKVWVINVGGYIGESTASEIEYAKACAKPIFYLEDIH